jgi:hypothetical protein
VNAVARVGFSMSRKFAVAISGAESKDLSLTSWPALPSELQDAMAKLAEAVSSREEKRPSDKVTKTRLK